MFKKILNLRDLWIGEKKGIIFDEKVILLVHLDEGVFAYDDHCPHAGALLSGGKLNNKIVTCPRHGWQFNVCTGKGTNPKDINLRQYSVWVDGERNVWIDLEHDK